MNHFAMSGIPMGALRPAHFGNLYPGAAYSGVLSRVTAPLAGRPVWQRLAMGAVPGAFMLLVANGVLPCPINCKPKKATAYKAMALGSLLALYLGSRLDAADMGDFGGVAGKTRRLSRRLARLQRRLAKSKRGRKTARLERRVAKIQARLSAIQGGAADPALTDATYVDEEDVAGDLVGATYDVSAYAPGAAGGITSGTPSWLLPVAIGGGMLLLVGAVAMSGRGQASVAAA